MVFWIDPRLLYVSTYVIGFMCISMGDRVGQTAGWGSHIPHSYIILAEYKGYVGLESVGNPHLF